jgi:hypothetical protein
MRLRWERPGVVGATFKVQELATLVAGARMAAGALAGEAEEQAADLGRVLEAFDRQAGRLGPAPGEAAGPGAAGAAPTAIDAFLDAVATGAGIPAELYAPDAVLDATVPNWRLHRHGPAAIAGEYTGWFVNPAEMEELTRWPTGGGEVVRYLLAWTEGGVPHAAHHCHQLVLDGEGRIASDTVFCGGRWPAGLMAEMAAAEAP